MDFQEEEDGRRRSCKGQTVTMGEPLSQSCFLITKHCRILIRMHPLHRCFLSAEIITIQHTLDTNKPIFQRKYLTKQCFDSLWSPWHPVKNGRSLSNDPEGHPGAISSTKVIPIALTRVYAQVGRVVDCKDCKECQEMHERLADLFKRSLTDNCEDSPTSNIQQT